MIERPWGRKGPLALVFALVIGGFLLRLPSFTDSLYGDELSTYFTVVGHGLGSTFEIVRGDQELTPPVYYMLSWVATQLGHPTEMLRVVSLLAGVAAIPLTYLLGLWTAGPRAGLAGAAILALNPFLIFYSTEARAYALVMTLALLSTLALLRALESPRPLGWWIAYAVFSCAALYTHYTAVFVLAAQLAWALWTRPGARRALLGANAAVVLGFLPWLPQFLDDSRSDCAKLIAGLGGFGTDAVRTSLGRAALGSPLVPLARVPGDAAAWLLVAALAIGAAGVAFARPRRPSARLTIVIVLALATPVGAAIYSLFGSSIYLSRNLIASEPAFAVAIGALVTSAGRLRLAATGLALTAFAIGAVDLLSARNQRPDYAGVARYIDRSGSVGDPVVEVPFPTPGPLTALYAALARDGALSSHPQFNLGFPSIATQLHARAPGGVGACASASLPPLPASAVAMRAAAAAGSGHAIYLVGLGSESFAALRSQRTTQQAAFIRALPSRFHFAGARTFPGLSGVGVTVYVLR